MADDKMPPDSMDIDIWDLQHPMRVDVDDPMFIPDRIDVAQMSGAGPLAFLETIAHDIASPFRSAFHLADEGVHAVAPIARTLEHAAMEPLRLLRRGADFLLPGPETSGADPMFIPDRIDVAQMRGELAGDEDVSGFSLSSIVHAATAPIRAAASIAHRTAMAPLYGLEKAVNAVTPGPPGGGGGGGGGAAPPPSPDPAPDDPNAYVDPGDGGEIPWH